MPAAFLAPKPAGLSHVESAALPLAGLTAWQGLFVHGQLQPNQRVLILGAAGGVGHLATQLATWRGAHVIGTASAAATKLATDGILRTAIDSVFPLEDARAAFDRVMSPGKRGKVVIEVDRA